MEIIKKNWTQNKVKASTIATAGIAGIFVTWFYFSPHLTVYGMQQAAQKQATQELSKQIDFPLLKASFKIELQKQVIKKIQKDIQVGNPFAGLSVALAEEYVNSVVETYISPANIALIMQGRLSNTQQQNSPQEKPESTTKISMEYKSYNSFVVHIKENNSKVANTVNLVYSRDGLANWKLSGIEVP